MKPIIKQRIEQIRNGEIPEGYKKTKYGIFPSNWTIDKMGNYIEEYRELSNDIDKYSVFSSSRKGLLPQSQYYDKREAVTTNLGYKIVPDGYVTYRHMSDDDVFHFNQNTTGDSVLVSGEYPVFSCNKYSNLYFIISLLNESPRFRHYCRMQKMGGTRTRLYYKNLCKYITCFPPLVEQRKIARILTAQDKIIECCEKKIELLKQMKKYYLQTMFPRKGGKVPKLRFNGFTDDWEQRKVTEIGYIYIGLVTTMTSHYTNSGALLIRNSDIRDGRFEFGENPIFLDEDFAKQNTSRKHRIGDVITVHTGDIGTSAVITEKEAGSIGFATIVTRPNTNIISSNYLCTYLNTDTHKNFAMNISTGDGRNNYNLKDYYECVVPMPCLEEQNRISELFSNLSNLITLHQRKLEAEKQKKKSLQQLLLTGIVRT